MRVHARRTFPTRDFLYFTPVTKTARVVEQMPYGYGVAAVGNLREVFANGVVDPYLASFGERKNSGGRELFAHGAGFKNSRRGVGHSMLEIGHPVGPTQDVVPRTLNGDGATGRIRMLVRSKNRGNLADVGRLPGQ